MNDPAGAPTPPGTGTIPGKEKTARIMALSGKVILQHHPNSDATTVWFDETWVRNFVPGLRNTLADWKGLPVRPTASIQNRTFQRPSTPRQGKVLIQAGTCAIREIDGLYELEFNLPFGTRLRAALDGVLSDWDDEDTIQTPIQ